MRELYSVHFSGTNITKKIVNRIKTNMEKIFKEEIFSYKSFNILKKKIEYTVEFKKEDIVIVGVPVYYGRVPEIIISSLKNLKGNDANAIIVTTYGNREVDDALLELNNILREQGLNIVGGIAVVGKHSIFSRLAEGRPNEEDFQIVDEFSLNSAIKIKDKIYNDFYIPGNENYRLMGEPHFFPKGDEKCDSCGICWNICPSKAIDSKTPTETNTEICIACGACIYNCPQNSRKYIGEDYYSMEEEFINKFFSYKKSKYYI